MRLSTPSTSAPSLVAGPPDAPAAALAARRKAFRALHERGCFVIPNPWDVGSARYLQHLGFPALATTSAGFAFSQGLPDSTDDVVVSRDRGLAHIASITAAVDVPVTADFMSGYGLEPEDVAESVARCVATGVAGLSIEDATGDATSPLYELPIAVERVRAARQAIDESGPLGKDVLLTARAECYHVGHPDPFRESVRRLQAYGAAGADVLFAPGPQTPDEIEALVAAIAPRPLNLLVVRDIGLSVEGSRRSACDASRWRRAGLGRVDRLHARCTNVEVRGQLRRIGRPRTCTLSLTASLRPIFRGINPGAIEGSAP